MKPLWLCVRARLRQDWRGLAVLTLITALMGSVALAGLAGAGLIVGVPLGLIAGRDTWLLFAGQVAIVPVPVISPLTLLALPVVLALANLIAAVPAGTAARTQPAIVLRAE